MKKLLIILAVIAIAAGIWYAVDMRDNPATEGDAAVVVNGEEVSSERYQALRAQAAREQGIDPSTLDATALEQFETQVTDTLVSQELILQAAADANVSVTDTEVQTEIENIKSRFDGDEAYAAALTAEGLTEENLVERIERELTIQKYLDQELGLSSITATDEEITALYESLSAGGEAPPLEEVRGQMEQIVVQQKQQTLISEHIDELRAEADIEVLI